MKKQILLIVCLSTTLLFGQAPRKVIVEDFTGAWCGFCPRGVTEIEDILNTYPNNVIGIAIHNGASTTDKMASTYSNAICASTSSGGINNGGSTGGASFPTGVVDRYKFPSESKVSIETWNWKTNVASRLSTTSPVSIGISSSYDIFTQAMSVTVTAVFSGSASGDLRINCILLEDSISGSGIGYDQHNYYGNGCSSPSSTSPWYNFPCNMTGFIHRHVARAALSATWGTPSIIPASVSAGATYTKSYNYTITQSSWKPERMSIVAFVSKYSATDVNGREILNSNSAKLGNTVLTGIEEDRNAEQIQVQQNIPNPFSEITAISFRLNTPSAVNVTVHDMFGREVKTLLAEKLIQGEHTVYWAGNDNNDNTVAKGMYFYTISSSSGSVSKPLIFTDK